MSTLDLYSIVFPPGPLIIGEPPIFDLQSFFIPERPVEGPFCRSTRAIRRAMWTLFFLTVKVAEWGERRGELQIVPQLLSIGHFLKHLKDLEVQIPNFDVWWHVHDFYWTLMIFVHADPCSYCWNDDGTCTSYWSGLRTKKSTSWSFWQRPPLMFRLQPRHTHTHIHPREGLVSRIEIRR